MPTPWPHPWPVITKVVTLTVSVPCGEAPAGPTRAATATSARARRRTGMATGLGPARKPRLADLAPNPPNPLQIGRFQRPAAAGTRIDMAVRSPTLPSRYRDAHPVGRG